MLPYTKNTLNKLEDLLQALGLNIRYERGTFKNNTCVLQQENLLVMNRFSDLEVKIRTISKIIQSTSLSEDMELDEKQKKLYYSLSQMTLL